jgi:hypothetical protein
MILIHDTRHPLDAALIVDEDAEIDAMLAEDTGDDGRHPGITWVRKHMDDTSDGRILAHQ